MTNTRCAPRCTAGDSGADWRIDPSPHHSRCPPTGSGTAGKMNGIAADASRCGVSITPGTAMRWDRSQGSNGRAVWQNVTWLPLV